MEKNNKLSQFLKVQFSKKMITIPVLIFVIVILVLIVFNFFLGMYAGNLKNNVEQKLTSSFEDIYNDDLFGGSTPEETFGLFLDALEKDELPLASQYFVIGNIQNQIYAYLRTIKKNETINLTSNQWRTALKIGEGVEDGSNRYAISYTIEVLKDSLLTDYTNGRQFKLVKGEYTNVIYFVKNKANVWKILSI